MLSLCLLGLATLAAATEQPIIVETSFESEWKVRPQALENALRRPGLQDNKLLVLNNPGNPCKT